MQKAHSRMGKPSIRKRQKRTSRNHTIVKERMIKVYSAKNMVVSGDYINGTIHDALGTLYITVPLRFGVVEVSRKTVIAIEDPEQAREKADPPQKKKGSGRSVIGSLSAKNGGFHQVEINFRNGKRSLVEVDGDVYREL